jgi:tetratricopeptide (TPR) repeat protein
MASIDQYFGPAFVPDCQARELLVRRNELRVSCRGFREGASGIVTTQCLLEPPYVLLNLALAFYKKGDSVNARERFESLHKAQPDDVRLAILLGDTYLRLGDSPAAVTMLTPLEAENAQNLDFEYVFGAALIKLGRQREGVSRMEKVAEAGSSADAYMLAGMTLCQGR